MDYIIKRFRKHIINWLKENFGPDDTIADVVNYLEAVAL